MDTSAPDYDWSKIPNHNKFLIIYNGDEDDSKRTLLNIEKCLKYIHKPYSIESKFYDSFISDPYEAVIVVTHDLTTIGDPIQLLKYATSGGSLIFSEYVYVNDAFRTIYRDLGIYDLGSGKITSGINLHDNILIKGTGLSVHSSDYESYSILLGINKDCKLLASSDDKTPLIWTNSYGNGNIGFINSSIITRKDSRGLFIGLLGKVIPNFIYPIFNFSLLYIDDFPAPISREINDVIWKYYKKNNEQFVRDIWWPDVLSSAKKNNMKYNCFFIDTYTDWSANPRFNLAYRGEVKPNLIAYGKEIISNGGEIGLHGYNHSSLSLERYDRLGYRPWKSESEMIEALEQANRDYSSTFGNYTITSYVPPSNVLTDQGRNALKSAIPSIFSISSLYIPGNLEGEYIQEYELSSDGIVELPRITSGYSNSDASLWNTYNAITSLGVFSHFVHPDDTFDKNRSNGSNWNDLFKSYDKLISNIGNNFSWLRSLTVSEAASSIKDYHRSSVFIEASANKVNVNTSTKFVQSFILRSSSNPVKAIGCKYFEIDKQTYLVQSFENNFEIQFDR